MGGGQEDHSSSSPSVEIGQENRFYICRFRVSCFVHPPLPDPLLLLTSKEWFQIVLVSYTNVLYLLGSLYGLSLLINVEQYENIRGLSTDAGIKVNLSVCLFGYVPVCLYVCLSVCMFVCLPVCLSVCMCVCLSV